MTRLLRRFPFLVFAAAPAVTLAFWVRIAVWASADPKLPRGPASLLAVIGSAALPLAILAVIGTQLAVLLAPAAFVDGLRARGWVDVPTRLMVDLPAPCVERPRGVRLAPGWVVVAAWLALYARDREECACDRCAPDLSMARRHRWLWGHYLLWAWRHRATAPAVLELGGHAALRAAYNAHP